MNTKQPTYLIELDKYCTAHVERVDGTQDGLCGPWPPRRAGESSLQQVRKALRRAEYVELIPAVRSLPAMYPVEYAGGGFS